MRPAGITVALAMYWLAGVVGAASFPPDDQYSPQPSSYRRDVAQGPRGYPNWLQYRQDPSAEFDPPENKPGLTTLKASDSPWASKIRKDSVIRVPDLLSSSPRRWNVATSGVTDNFTDRARSDLEVPEDSEISSASREDLFVADDTFQDQGPGSVEVYKLDLLRENSLLVPEAKKAQQPIATSRTKSKAPKKATAEEILWKLKPIEPSKASLPAIFRQPPRLQRIETSPRETDRRINENRKDEVFAVGGVPELQVGCEGLEASDRKRRSSGPGEEEANDEDSDDLQLFKFPVYRESTEPILSRVTPIVLDFDDEPPSGEVYEEMDELLKLKNLESTSAAPTPRRKNRADIDPALAIHFHDDLTNIETFPERGDLGPVSNDTSKFKRSIRPEGSQASHEEAARYRRETDIKDEDASSPITGSHSESSKHRAGRKLLWVEYPERHEQDNRARSRHHQTVNDNRNDQEDLWGFGEDDGVVSGGEDDSEAEQLRRAEMEKRRREYERRKQELLERRRGGHRSHSQENHSRNNDVNSQIERIRMEYEQQLEKEQRERQRIANQRRHQGGRRHWDEDDRRREEMIRRREEESRRRMDEENARNHRDPPSPLTRPEPTHHANRSRNYPEDREAEERKLREYIERNRPIDPKSRDSRRRPEDESRRRNDDERRRYMEEEQRRQQMEEHRRRHQQPDEDQRARQMEEHRRRQQQRDEEERRRQMEEHRRRHPDESERRHQMEEQRRRQQSDEDERRRQMEEQRRRDRPDNRETDEDRRHRLEEERKLQDYVRRNQPVNVPRRNNSEIFTSQEEQRRTLEAARQYERNRVMPSRRNDGRSHGPSAPTDSGHRQSPSDLEEMRRRQEADSERRRLEDEERRREEEYRRAESRRLEEDRKRLEAIRRTEENRRSQSEGRRSSWQESSRRPANTPRRGSVGGEVRDREAEELRRQEAARRTSGNSTRNQDYEWKRRSEERDRQRQEQEQRERVRMENERNSRNNGRRRPQHEDTGFRQRGESARGLEERRRREHARLSSLPVSARIIIRSKDGSRFNGESQATTLPTPLFDTRGGFDNDIDFPAINPNRRGLAAGRFPAPATRRPPAKSPGACVWAIVQCCPANNRLTTCFESMGCPGVNWDPNPCRGALADAARAEVVRFYEEAEEDRARF